ncbi:glycoside hydrolase family 36 protein [Bifidobacterium platyrrhinorum]|uniref:Alpha-galactosidase n=1 Tax=Bifidobacterium platyrrhinorum TaxID=2661628 RepID=A0A6L9STY3_9BIFI|nr:glycoside hydrolase family 36 protein [Bifidobacterium platyrrhinorum]NEG55589.1 alpha-galactosidase [Bifidobacterium platyrrhinorum]
MAGTFTWGNDAVTLRFAYADDKPVVINGIEDRNGAVAFPHEQPFVEVLAAGRGTGHWICNHRLTQTSLGQSLRYRSSNATSTDLGDELDIVMASDEYGFTATAHFLLPRGCRMFRTTVTIANTADTPLVLESATSFAASFGTRDPDGGTDFDGWNLLQCDTDWLGEGRWHETPMRELCPFLNQQMVGRDPQGTHEVISEGTFSTGTALPIGVLRNVRGGLAWAFQVEHNGAWRWEAGEDNADGYFALSGPDYRDHGWTVSLDKGETFTTVPASAVLGKDFDDAIAELTAYRRAMHNPDDDIVTNKVVFNDYMNTLNGDPTTDKLLPLIPRAAEAGAEIFCVDAGWYDDTGYWWPSVGEWKPSTVRFPNGLGEVIDAIHANGMVPGLWLEPEVVGVESPVAEQLPDEAFFLNHGQRVVEQQRYLLDFRNPIVIDHMNAIVDRLIDEFGVGYFKFDYNVMPGPGTTRDADSAGDGLLGHNRAYTEWIKGLYRRHPGLILENCSSGGMRTDFAQSSNFQLLSTSDQQDFRLYPVITAAAPMSMLPEQAGNWAYPERSMNDEEFTFAITNSLLGRFFLSGYVNRFSDRQMVLVEDAVEAYKNVVRPVITRSVPFWPLGLAGWTDDVVSTGLRADDTALISVWSRNCAGREVELVVPEAAGRAAEVTTLYPVRDGLPEWASRWDATTGTLHVTVPASEYVARTFRVAFAR